MIVDNEITVLVTSTYEKLHKKLIENNFCIKEEYELNDIYMIDKSIDILSFNTLELLKHCILVRDIVGIKKVLLYKYKKNDDKGDILEQGKVECPVYDIDKAIKFMETISYRQLFKIHDKCIVYANDRTELVVQLVNNRYIFIEMEQTCEYIDRKYSGMEELKEDINSYDIPFDRNNYFVKKAELILKEVIKNNGDDKIC